HWAYNFLIRSQSVSVFHEPHYDVPLTYKGPLIVTVHDLIHVLYPEHSTKPFSKYYARYLLKHVAEKADIIISVSENTKRDLLKYFPVAEGKIRVLNPAVGENFHPVKNGEGESFLRRQNLQPGYLLYVGNLRGSKNTMMMIKTYEVLRNLD